MALIDLCFSVARPFARVIVAQLFESLGRQAAGSDAAPVAWWRRLLQSLGVMA